MATLSHVPDLKAGYLQLVTWKDLSFVHLHFLTEGGGEQPHWEAMLSDLWPRLHFPLALLQVGDFNCVLNGLNTEDQAFLSRQVFQGHGGPGFQISLCGFLQGSLLLFQGVLLA
jgi:hypothetical protein